jgi:hypothetical protein
LIVRDAKGNRLMVVEVGPEIEQFILQICTRPEQHVIQIFASNGANVPFHEGMRQGNVGDGLDFCHLQDPQACHWWNL